ncbi:MAG: TIGR02300 family protein [Rhodobacteraceae bacterium]|nr:TIGR02300 family protein [Paracoccaceae bacterium]
MPKQDWGVKRVCPETGKRFYDLNNDPIVSPYTGKEYEPGFFAHDRSRTTMADKEEKSAIKKATAADDNAGDVDLDDDVIDEDEDGDVSIEEIADMPAGDDDS